jgi:hypothetical protein
MAAIREQGHAEILLDTPPNWGPRFRDKAMPTLPVAVTTPFRRMVNETGRFSC